MKQFINRYCLRLGITFGCWAFILAPATREYGLVAVAFMAGTVVEPWIQAFEKLHDEQSQMDVMTEAARPQQRQETSS